MDLFYSFFPLNQVLWFASPLLLNLKLTNDGEKTFKKKSEEMMAKKTSQ
jgi:hypothetical protein